MTNLNDSGTGSLRAGVESDAKRIIVFDVSGTIHLTRQLNIKSNTTIMGQTAPGDGICVADYPCVVNGDNVIVRYMRFRLGNKNVANHEGDGFGSLDHRNIIIDHCSFPWSVATTLPYNGVSPHKAWSIAVTPKEPTAMEVTGVAQVQLSTII